MTNFDAQVQQAGQRARVYWLLSRLFLEVPTASMLAELSRILAAADAAVSPDMVALRAAVDAAPAEPNAAAIAFTQHLCLGDRKAGEALPFEAHVREGCLPGESTQQVAAMIRDAGYDDVAPEASSPDHLGTELRFMSLLCHRELEAWSEGNRVESATSLRLQHEFLSLHLAQWAPGYCRGLAERTTNDYLRAVAMLAASSIDDDVAILDEICRWLVPTGLAPLSPAEGTSASGARDEAAP